MFPSSAGTVKAGVNLRRPLRKAKYTSMTFFGKIGVPGAILLFDYQFLPILLFTVSAGLLGNIVFVNLSYQLIKGIHAYRSRRNKIHSKKIFTPTVRRIIRVKSRFGLVGISLIGPMFLSVPLAVS